MDAQTLSVVTDAQMWALVVGFLSPLLIAVVQRPHLADAVRVLIAVGWSVLAGTGTAFFNGQLTGRGVVSCILVVLVTAIASYQQVWKPTKVAPWIEAKTSGGAYQVTTKTQTAPSATQVPGAGTGAGAGQEPPPPA